MPDARNSSNAVREGGARQTGGAGRTQKRATGNHKTDLLGQQGLRAHQEQSDTKRKRKLQLQLTSKQLAADVRADLLENHTEEEYEERQVPLPSDDVRQGQAPGYEGVHRKLVRQGLPGGVAQNSGQGVARGTQGGV